MNISFEIESEYLNTLFDKFFPYPEKEYTDNEKLLKITDKIENTVLDMIGEKLKLTAIETAKKQAEESFKTFKENRKSEKEKTKKNK